MSTHLTNREIDNFVSGLASDKDAKMVEEHLELCPQCRMIVDSLSNIVAKQPSGDVPGEHIRDKVIAEWYKLHNEYIEKKFSARLKMKRLVAGLAVAASVVIAVSSYLFFNKVKIDNGYPLAISSSAGDLYKNDLRTAVNDILEIGDVLTSGKDSSAVISSDDFSLYISEVSSLRVAGNSKKDGIIFALNGGSVFSKSSGSTRYSFLCGDYKIVPSGTEFMIQFLEGELSVAVSQGKVVVTGPDVHVEISEGMKWSSQNAAKLENRDAETLANINSAQRGHLSGNTGLSSGDENKSAVKDYPEVKSGSEKVKNNSDTGSLKSITSPDRKEKIESRKVNRELRDEMNEMKKEQRKEQRKEKNKRNNG